MSRLKLVLGILALLIVAQGIAIGFLALLLYQSTPNAVLARDTFIGKIPGVLSTVRIFDRASNVFYRGPKAPEALAHYSLTIDPEDLQKIEEALPTDTPSRWYSNVFLTDDAKVWVKGEFTADGVTYDVKVRVRGDIFNHWAYRKKSWRVKFDKDKLFRGMREINLIIPEDRNWFGEKMSAERAQSFGLLYPPMEFVTVSLNGSGPLLYTQVEHWGKEMLEKQARPGDVNLYKTGGGTSRYQQWDPVFEEVAYWDKYESEPGADTYEQVETLMEFARDGAHKEPGYLDRLSSILDLEKTVAWYAVGILAGSRHIDDFNLRLFFDTTRGKFEPIPWDIGLYGPSPLLVPPESPLLREIFRVPEMRLKAYQLVWEYVNDEERIESDLELASHLRSLIEEAAYRDSLKLSSNRTVRQELNTAESMIKRNIDFLKEELTISETLLAQRIAAGQPPGGQILELDVTARGVAPAMISALKFPEELRLLTENGNISLWRDSGDGVLSNDDVRVDLILEEELDKKGRVALSVVDTSETLLWTGDPVIEEGSGDLSAPHTHHLFFVELDLGELPEDALPLKVSIDNAVTGKDAEVIREVVVDDRALQRLEEATATREEFLARYPMFQRGEGNEVVLRGTRTIGTNEVIIVPSTVHLVVKPGTILRMREGASILSYAPVTMIGTPVYPIIVRAYTVGQPWGVFAVLNAREQSAVQWAEFSEGSEATINGTFFSGMFAFHSSPVVITDSVFYAAHGDDGLNLKNVHVDLNRLRFERNDFDGLDIDNALSGIVENSVFKDNGNDGLDISWSPIIIRAVTVEGSGDKCLSVGERSAPLIYDSSFTHCHYGIAVKDDSHAKLERVVFEDNAIAVGAYIKKSFFGPPSVVINESEFLRNDVQKETMSGAVISIDSAM